jgi:hypothetical protein
VTDDIIAYIQYLNKELESFVCTVAQWIYTMAQKGKGRLDTHLSFVNTVFLSKEEMIPGWSSKYRTAVTTVD